MQTVLSDNKCQELWHLLKRMRRKDHVTLHDVVRYRREAEHHVGSDDHLYKVDCVSNGGWSAGCSMERGADAGWVVQDGASRTLRIQLLSVTDPSTDEDSTAVGRWREYVATYVLKHPTEWMLGQDRRKTKSGPLFLKR